MKHLSDIIVLLVFAPLLFAQSPHGDNFKRDCSLCHQVENWKVDPAKISFNHEETGFALEDQHATIACRACHNSLIFTLLKEKNQCINCHKDIHENTLGNNCKRCHTIKTWIIEKISDLHRNSRFPLIGGHAKADCFQCHKSASNLKFDVLGIRCFDCHSLEYYATQNPNHVRAGYSTDCTQCHNYTTLNWTSQSIVHDFFPLTGGHAISNCFACHTQNTFAGLSSDCYTCHQSNYISAINHVAQSYPTNCKICHTIVNWQQTAFNHSTTSFPLTGKHLSITCTACHTNGFAAGSVSTICSNCHMTDYNNTTNPNHVTAKFPLTCDQCHNTSAWSPSTFNHDSQYFPIYSGTHRQGVWTLCSDCHTDPVNFISFTCINCHSHSNQSSVASEHRNVSGFAYTPTSCYDCHRSGRSGG